MVKAATFAIGDKRLLTCGITLDNRGVLEELKLPENIETYGLVALHEEQ